MLSLIWDDHTPPVWPTNVRRHWKRSQKKRTLQYILFYSLFRQTLISKAFRVISFHFVLIGVTLKFKLPKAVLCHLKITDKSYPLQKGLTTVYNTEVHLFILIRDGRLAIDYHSYGNLSKEQNLHLHSLSHLSSYLIILNAFNWNSSGLGARNTVAVLVSEWREFEGVQHVTLWHQLIAVNFGTKQGVLLLWVKEEDDAAAYLPSLCYGKQNHFINL